MSAKTKAVYIIVGALLMAAIIAGTALVLAQNTAATQRWEYAMLLWNSNKDEFSFVKSTVYGMGELEVAFPHESTQTMWDALDDIGGLIDYQAIMGISGYELVAVTQISVGYMAYTYKRPLD